MRIGSFQNIKTLVLGSLFAVSLNLSAQDIFDQDARMWIYFKFDKYITKRFNTQLIIQNRFDNNISQYGQLNGNIEFSYKISKNFKPLLGYVYGKTQRIDLTYADRHQGYAGFIARYRLRKVIFYYRQLVQAEVVDYNRSKKGHIPYWYDRNKVTVKYEINKRFETYIAEEINVDINGKHPEHIHRYRTFVGLQYNLSRRSYIEGYFLLQRKVSYKNLQERDFIYGITYSHSF